MKFLLFALCVLPTLAFTQATTTFWTENCESNPVGWTLGGWARSSRTSNGGTYSLETNGNLVYSNNTSYILTSKSIDISDYSDCKLTFYAKIDTEEEYDGAYIEASGDGGSTWVKLYNAQLNYSYDGKLPSGNILGSGLAWYKNISSWKQIVVDLSDFEGTNNFMFRISFGSDAYQKDWGMNVDDFAVYGYPKTTIHNSGGFGQLVFDNSYLYIDIPTFRLSSDIASTFNRFRIEINKSPQFSDISYVQEFNTSYNSGNNYIKGAEYNFTCNQLNPPQTFEDNTTYYVRAAASNNGGSSWGKWSNIISFTYKTTQNSKPQWHQMVDWQFKNNTLQGTESKNNIVGYKPTISISQTIKQTSDDVYDRYDEDTGVKDYYDEADNVYIGYEDDDNYVYTTGLRFNNITIPQGATITNSFIVIDCNYPDKPGYGIVDDVTVDIYGHDVDNSSTFSSGNTPRDRMSSITSSFSEWAITDVWYDYSYYQTPNIKTITKEIVDRPGWSSGNSITYLIRNKDTIHYRKIRTIDSDPGHAAQLYIEYENTDNGIITSSPIYLASFDGATNWRTLFWDEEGSIGDFTVTIQEYSGGVWSNINASYTNLNYNRLGHDISGLNSSIIRLVGTFTPSSKIAPVLNSWTVTVEDLSTGTADLTLSLNASDLAPCEQSEIIYTLSVANNGPDEATGVMIDFAIPVGLTFASSDANKGFYNSTSGQWIVDALQDAETAVLTITATVNSGQGGNTITSNSNVALMQTDINADNNSVSLDIKVNAGTAPQISVIPNQQTSFNTSFTTINYTVTDAETNSDLLTYSALANDVELIPNSNYIFDGTGTNRTLDITPGTNQYGTTEVTITVDDGTCTSTETFKAQVVRHQYTNMESANLVVGQPNFTSTTAATNASTTPGASSCMISPLGHLVVGSQHTSELFGDDGRIMLWNTLPTTNGESCDVVLGKLTDTSEIEGCSNVLTRSVDGVAFSADGSKLLVSDAGNNRVLIWNTIPTSTAEAADVVIGQANFTANTSGCSSTKMNSPKSLVVTPDGKLYIADYGNNRILVYNYIPTINGTSADVVIGQDNFNTNTSGNTANKMDGPWDISISIEGKLLISDVNNNRILVFNSIPTQNGVSADYVVGQEDFGISSAGLAPNKFNFPIGVTVSPTGLLAVGEFVNQRVLIFNEIPQENGDLADIVLGQNDFFTNAQYNNGSGSTGTAANNNFENPYTIFFDINDRLFVNGRDMNRVMVFGDLPTEESDLEISINSDTDTPCMGNPVSYFIDITNNGKDDATNLVANAALPCGFYYYDHKAESGTYDPAGGNWQIPTLSNGATITLIITGTVDYSLGGKTIETYASVRSNNQKETNYINNADSKTITIIDNSSPFVSRIADQQRNVNISTGIINFTVRDEDGSVSSITATSSDQNVVQNGNITLGGSGENRTIKIDPVTGVHGVTTITVSVSDGTCTTIETFNCSFGNLWIGKTTDWHTKANWGGEVPKSGVDVYIPASPAGGNFPLISNNVEMRDIYLEKGVQLNANNPVTIKFERNIYNNGIITINNGTTIVSGAGVTIRGVGTLQMHDANLSGTITCSSNLGISGAWNRTGTFTHNSGIVTFNGDVAQTITLAENFYSLGVNNSAGVTFSNNISVADTLKLIDGAIIANNSFVLADEITIERTSGSLINVPTFGNTTNIVYKGSVTAGKEIPSSNSVGDLKINGTGIEVTLPFTLKVNNELSFINGIITTGSNSLNMLNPNVSKLIGGSETSFVNGTLVRYIASNKDSYNFPIGNGTAITDYLPAQFINNNLTGTNYLIATVGSLTESGNNIDDNLTVTESGGNNYVNVVENGLWQITPNSEPSGGTYGIRLFFNDAIAANLTDNEFGILKRPSNSTSYADWNSYGNTTTVPALDADGRTIAGGYAERLGYTSFSEFVIASSQYPLPVKLISFKGIWNKGGVLIEWLTATEYENDYFVLEKSTDGLLFTEIARIDGAGTVSTPHSYSVMDCEIQNHIYYYRLKQFDFDGTETNEGIIAVNCPVIDDAQIKVYPQPAENELNIRLNAFQENNVSISITNSLGETVFSNQTQVLKGFQTVSIDCTQLNKGWYVLQIADGNTVYQRPIIIGD